MAHVGPHSIATAALCAWSSFHDRSHIELEWRKLISKLTREREVKFHVTAATCRSRASRRFDSLKITHQRTFLRTLEGLLFCDDERDPCDCMNGRQLKERKPKFDEL